MALLMAMKRATSSSTLFSKLVNRLVSTPVDRRYFSSGHLPIINSAEHMCTINVDGGLFTRSYNFSIEGGISDGFTENPFQISGEKGTYEVKKVDEGLFVRMEMPGIAKDDVKIWVESNHVIVKGQGQKESLYEDSGRSYSGSIELCSNVFHPDKIKADMRNGVLRILIPKAASANLDLGILPRNGVSNININ